MAAFISAIEAAIGKGDPPLSAEAGQALIDAAQKIIDLLSSQIETGMTSAGCSLTSAITVGSCSPAGL